MTSTVRITALAMALVGITALALASSIKQDTNGPTHVELAAVSKPKACDFNRVAIHPQKQIVVAWTDRRPNALHSGTFAPASEIVIAQAGTAPAFIQLRGEVSALNWRSDGKHVEFFLNGNYYVLLAPKTGTMRIWPVDPIWAGVNVKNQRWDAAREALEDRELIAEIAQGNGRYSKFAGVAMLAAQNTLMSAADLVEFSGEGHERVSIFDIASPLSLLMSNQRLTELGLPIRPVFDASTGRSVGYQSLRGIVQDDGVEAIVGTDRGMLKDAVSRHDSLALLFATPDGAHRVSIRSGRDEDANLWLCGLRDGGHESVPIVFDADELKVAALLHQQRDQGKTRSLAIRFHGGPFGSVEDSYPFVTTRKLASLGFDILEVDGIGARSAEAGMVPPRVTPGMISSFNAELADWIAHRHHKNIVIIGESFGAVGAVDLALQMSRSDGAGNPSQSVSISLLAPLTSLSLERSMSGRKHSPWGLQTMAENLAFGQGETRTHFAEWLSQRMAQACELTGLTVIVGADDRRTPISQQAPCIQRSMAVLQGRDHASLFNDPRTWQWLR